MGGDFAPEAAVKGAVMAVNELGADSHIVLFGDEEQIKAIEGRLQLKKSGDTEESSGGSSASRVF